MTVFDWIVVAGFATLAFEVFVWRVPSVASTYELVQAEDAGRSSWLLYALPTTLGVATFLLPLVFAFTGVPDWCLPLEVSDSIAWFAVGLIAAGRFVTLSAVGHLRRALRDGCLVTGGPFRRSRNPALVGLHVFFVGNCLIYPCVVLAVGLGIFVVNMHFRVRIEEEHLQRAFGEDYAQYCARVRRYV